MLGILRGQQMRAREGRSEVRAGTHTPKGTGGCKRPRYLVGMWPLQRLRKGLPLRGMAPGGESRSRKALPFPHSYPRLPPNLAEPHSDQQGKVRVRLKDKCGLLAFATGLELLGLWNLFLVGHGVETPETKKESAEQAGGAPRVKLFTPSTGWL